LEKRTKFVLAMQSTKKLLFSLGGDVYILHFLLGDSHRGNLSRGDMSFKKEVKTNVSHSLV
jgi:hypothetical protein